MPIYKRISNLPHFAPTPFELLGVSKVLRGKQFPNSKFQKGFTLLEFLVVIGILAFVVSSTLLFLNSVLKTANQSHIVGEVKQNGQAALNILDKEIRNAVNAEGIDWTGSSYSQIKLIRDKGDPLFIKCLMDGAVGVKNNRIGSVVSTSTPVDSQFMSLTNDDTVSGVDVTACGFEVLPAAVVNGVDVPAVVKISFTVSQGLDAPRRIEFYTTQSYQTTISLRRY